MGPFVAGFVRASVIHFVLASLQVWVFPDDIPMWAKLELKDIGNMTNEEVSKSTPLEAYRAHATIEAGWDKKKKQEGWSLKTMSIAELEDKKTEFFKGLFGVRFWNNITTYNFSNTFWSSSLRTPVPNELVAIYEPWRKKCFVNQQGQGRRRRSI